MTVTSTGARVDRRLRRGLAVDVRVPRATVLVASLLIALAGVLAPPTARVAQAAEGSLDLQAAATYHVSPADHAVHVTVDITARNLKPNQSSGGILTRYFYDRARLGIQEEARNVAAREDGVPLTTTTTPADGFRIVDVRFRRSLFFHETATLRLTFDLPAGKPRSASDVRVGSAFVTFVAWAFGDRGSVRVEIPSAFDAQTTGSAATKSTRGSTTVYRATGITDVNSWYLVVSADRESALTRERIDLPGGEHVVIRAWPEDREWLSRVRDLLTRGLPELTDDTGLDWPVERDISVFEVHTPLLEGYSGFFYAAERRIEISEDLEDLTILHEASHAWFNSGLFTPRWLSEGFADTYAAMALGQIGEAAAKPKTVTPADPAAFKLETWQPPGRITDAETEAREAFGYDASWTVVRALVDEIGLDGMRRVLDAAEARTIAYVGDVDPESVGVPADWRRVLDLLEEAGGSSKAEALFRRWILTDGQAGQLAARADARAAYATLVARGGDGWAPPFLVRTAMASWQFAEVGPRIEAAKAVLAKRDEIATLGAALGLAPTDAVRQAYIGARASLDAANRLADDQLAALEAIEAATSAVGRGRAVYTTIGLIGETPEAGLAAARAAFPSDAAAARAAADAVTKLVDDAVGVGRSRLQTVAIVVGIAVVVLIAVALVVLRRRRSRRRASLAPAVAGAAVAPYATLADPVPEPVSEPEIEPPGAPTTPGEEPGDAS